jgi:threonine dehydratase
VLRTPLRHSEWLSAAARADVYLKLETLQPTFSYKIRGAWNAILAMRERGSRSALVTASAGNHGRSLAHAAHVEGLSVRVYVPATTPRTKLEAIRAAGADVRTCDDYDDAERQAQDHARQSGATYISPYSHPDVIAGAGTVALEILEDLAGINAIVVPVGGGGLISGVAIAADGSGAAVWGVEAEASCPFTTGLAAGRIVPITVAPTLADGLAGNLDPHTITFDIVRQLVETIAVVREDDIRAGIRGMLAEERLVVEGAAAAAVAAVLALRLKAGPGKASRIAVVLSGANIDPETLRAII